MVERDGREVIVGWWREGGGGCEWGGGHRGRQGVAHSRNTCDRYGCFMGSSIDWSQVLLEISRWDLGVSSM